jgi:hypothetical protein
MSVRVGTIGNCAQLPRPCQTAGMPPRRSAAGPRSWLPLVLATIVLVGCGPDAPKGCLYQTPVCPDPPPSYAGEVNAIIQATCVGCHGPGGQEAIRPFTTWQDIDSHAYAGPMQRQVLGCLMPPADSPQLSDAQKQALVGWLTCGAPNN